LRSYAASSLPSKLFLYRNSLRNRVLRLIIPMQQPCREPR
jgi:hypothetical protein